MSETKTRFVGKTIIHKANTRGHFDYGWLKTYHTFSFSNYYDPERVNFGMLRVLNDDTIEAGEGFGTHPHNDMEIVTIPLEGAVAHKDSTGGEGVIYPDEIQVMSAGTGIHHSEYNHLNDGTTKLLQLWIFPDKKGHEPRYNQKFFNSEERKNKLQFIVTPEKKGDNLWLNQDAYLALSDLEKSKSLNYKIHTKGNGVYLFLIDGNISVGDDKLFKRDGIGLWETEEISINASEDSRLLFIEVPMM
ncbi:MAG: pirin family protein [Ignavibacteriaceae bacterium]|nr:pirin family protein [Ignavibacteriaceae bacterium]MEB2295693.1 pirin family protein [Ignavibacteria bacterium]